MIFFIADAFTGELFGGNPAGVVLIPDGQDFPPAERMRQTAAELRYSETAFVKQLDAAHFETRYFTPANEVDLCGHATVASFYCLAAAGRIGNPVNCINHTLAGDITVSVNGDAVFMDMAPPKYIGHLSTPFDLDRLYETMGSEWDASMGLDPELISTGLPDIMMPVPTREELAALQPDMELLTKLTKDFSVTGVHAFTLDTGASKTEPKKETDAGKTIVSAYAQGGLSAQDGIAENIPVTAYARNFAPLYGIPEEAATGTSNGALTYYLYLHRLLPPQAKARIIQGEAMGRPSEILTQIDATDTNNIRIRVGGKACILAEGEIHL